MVSTINEKQVLEDLGSNCLGTEGHKQFLGEMQENRELMVH